MHRIKRFAFLLGGVLVPRIGDVIQPLRPDFSLDTVELYQLKKQLTLGQLSLNDFCKRLESLSSEIDVSWERDFPLLITYNEAMQPVLDILARDFELVLLADYPTPWSDGILKRSPFSGYFSQIVEIASAGPYESYRSLFANLLNIAVIHPGNTILVDWNSHRTRSAISVGLDAAIFVDTARFYRDLGLWGIVPLLDINSIKRGGISAESFKNLSRE